MYEEVVTSKTINVNGEFINVSVPYDTTVLIDVKRSIINGLPKVKKYVFQSNVFNFENPMEFILKKFEMEESYFLESDPPLNTIFNKTVEDGDPYFRVDAFKLAVASWTFSKLPEPSVMQYGNDFQRAFSSSFLDNDNASRFLSFLVKQREKYKTSNHLALYTSVVNASGVGKSRLFRQLGENVTVIYCCLRHKSSTGFPKRSLIAESLLEENLNTVAAEYIERYAAYFIASLTTLMEYKAEHKYSSTDLFDVQSSDLYQAKLQIAFYNARQKLPKKPNNRLEELETKSWSESLFKHVFECLNKLVANKNHLFLFVFDEARSLLNPKGAAMLYTNRSLFSYLQKAMIAFDKFVPHNVMGVVLDTLSKVSNFQPQDKDPSLRCFDKGQVKLSLLNPYFQIDTIDTHLYLKNIKVLVEYLEKNELGALEGMMNVDYSSSHKQGNLDWIFDAIIHRKYNHIELGMMVFGRPLWFSTLLGSTLAYNNEIAFLSEINKIVALASVKLMQGVESTLSKKFEDNKLFFYALLSISLGSRLRLSETASEKLMSDMMAYCFYVSDDRSSVMCGYGIEPALANGVTDIICERTINKAEVFPNIELELIKAVGYITSMGYVDMEEIGELIGRLILIFAMHHCLRAEAEENPIEKSLMQPISVKRYLTSLLNLKNGDLNSIGDDLLEGILFFNHFYSVNSCIKHTDLISYFTRCVAIFCNQPGIDIILPVYLKGGRFTFILVQIKYLSDGTNSNVSQVLGKCNPIYGNIIDSTKELDLPYISIYIQLGGSTEFATVGDSHLIVKTRKGKDKAGIEEVNKIKMHQKSITCLGISTMIPWLECNAYSKLKKTVDGLKLNPLQGLYDSEDDRKKYLNSIIDSCQKTPPRSTQRNIAENEEDTRKKKKIKI